MSRRCHTVGLLSFLLGTFLLAVPAVAQGPDSARIGIHELESESHRWDILRTDSTALYFLNGKASALRGDYDAAERDFRKGLRRRRADALFNLGLLYLYQERLEEALRCFKASNAAQPDSLCRHQMGEIRRRIREREEMNHR